MAIRQKRKVVKQAVFLPKYLEAVKAGKTQQEFADSLGMNIDTVRVRISTLREKLAEKNKRLPDLKDARQGRRAQTEEEFLAQVDDAFSAAGVELEALDDMSDDDESGDDSGDE